MLQTESLAASQDELSWNQSGCRYFGQDSGALEANCRVLKLRRGCQSSRRWRRRRRRRHGEEGVRSGAAVAGRHDVRHLPRTWAGQRAGTAEISSRRTQNAGQVLPGWPCWRVQPVSPVPCSL